MHPCNRPDMIKVIPEVLTIRLGGEREDEDLLGEGLFHKGEAGAFSIEFTHIRLSF